MPTRWSIASAWSSSRRSPVAESWVGCALAGKQSQQPALPVDPDRIRLEPVQKPLDEHARASPLVAFTLPLKLVRIVAVLVLGGHAGAPVQSSAALLRWCTGVDAAQVAAHEGRDAVIGDTRLPQDGVAPAQHSRRTRRSEPGSAPPRRATQPGHTPLGATYLSVTSDSMNCTATQWLARSW
jgi:hypothetical protein